jgi:hypothetical protein
MDSFDKTVETETNTFIANLLHELIAIITNIGIMKTVIGRITCLLHLSGTSLVASFIFRQAGPQHQQRQASGLISENNSNINSKLCAAKKKASAKSQKAGDADGDKNDEMDPAKRAALQGVLSQIERSYGRGSVVRLGDASHMIVDSTPTGSLTLDAALGGGGYPKGRIVEIYGPESSGKTTLALHAIAECQKLGGTAAFVDAEHALDPVYGT